MSEHVCGQRTPVVVCVVVVGIAYVTADIHLRRMGAEISIGEISRRVFARVLAALGPFFSPWGALRRAAAFGATDIPLGKWDKSRAAIAPQTHPTPDVAHAPNIFQNNRKCLRAE